MSQHMPPLPTTTLDPLEPSVNVQRCSTRPVHRASCTAGVVAAGPFASMQKVSSITDLIWKFTPRTSGGADDTAGADAASAPAFIFASASEPPTMIAHTAMAATPSGLIRMSPPGRARPLSHLQSFPPTPHCPCDQPTFAHAPCPLCAQE